MIWKVVIRVSKFGEGRVWQLCMGTYYLAFIFLRYWFEIFVS